MTVRKQVEIMMQSLITSIIKCSGRLWLEATHCAEEGTSEVAGEVPPAP